MAFLTLLVFELAVNLEWLFPPKADAGLPEWLQFLPLVVTLAALSLCGGCPEDRPGSDRAFFDTRPIKRSTYWMAALLAGMLLIVLPAALQNGLYLLLSDRPSADVMRGMGERAFFIVGIGLWGHPFNAVAGKSEMWLFGIVSLLLTVFGVSLMPLLLRLMDEEAPIFDQPPRSWIFASLILAVSLSLLAWWHQRRPLGLRLRLGVVSLLIVGALLLCLYCPLRTAPLENRDPAQAQALSEKHEPVIHPESISFHDESRSFYLSERIHPAAPGIHISLNPVGYRVTQNDLVSDEHWEPWVDSSRVQGNLRRVDRNLAAFFPPRTIFVKKESSGVSWQGVENSTGTPFASLTPEFQRDQAVQIEARFRADWWRRERLLDTACIAGTHDATRDVAWNILETHPHMHNGGTKDLEPRRGAFTLRVSMQRRQHWDRGLATAFILHSPQRGIAWLVPSEIVKDVRAGSTGLERRTLLLSWQDVLNYADGEDARVDPAQLRLVLISGYHLGESIFTWKTPSIVPRDHHREFSQPDVPGMIHLARGKGTFQQRVASLKVPTAQSGKEEVRQYLYDAIMAYRSDWSSSSEASEKDVEALFMPLFEHHLDEMLRLPRQMLSVGKDSVMEKLFVSHLREEHRDVVLQRLADVPHLIPIVLKRGWAEAARPLWHARLMKSTHLPQEFIPLLLAWGDQDSFKRIAALMSFKLDSWHFTDKPPPPELTALLKPIAQSHFEACIPFENRSSESSRPLRAAADFGDTTAFDLCLRLLALDGKSNRSNSAFPHLLDAGGKRIWMSWDDPDSNTRLFRHRTHADFEYLPEKLAWRVLP
ncbi:MAG: hypothetical protein IPK22_13520 [Verrucomicrobiaceae bacterium]|nr:hypothetical protein [Verrucomicrobiaceae bacterium]